MEKSQLKTEPGNFNPEESGYNQLEINRRNQMKKTLEIEKIPLREPVVRDWLRYELTEDDFLLGKTYGFSPGNWEEEE